VSGMVEMRGSDHSDTASDNFFED
jgi:hypothetical protein